MHDMIQLLMHTIQQYQELDLSKLCGINLRPSFLNFFAVFTLDWNRSIIALCYCPVMYMVTGDFSDWVLCTAIQLSYFSCTIR